MIEEERGDSIEDLEPAEEEADEVKGGHHRRPGPSVEIDPTKGVKKTADKGLDDLGLKKGSGGSRRLGGGP